MTFQVTAALVVLATLGAFAVAGLFFALANVFGRALGLAAVGGVVLLFSAGFTSCSTPPVPPPQPPRPANGNCADACAHLANIGCGSGECDSLCEPVQLPGYAACLEAAETCDQADACDTASSASTPPARPNGR